eukprot:Gb_02127 [translate_table: standard]
MSNGMAYGRGIYFSTLMDTSRRYSIKHPGWVNGKLRECSIVAICEIFLEQTNYIHGSNFVVPPEHENDIAIRYLVVFNGEHYGSNIVHITHSHLLSDKTDLHKHYEQLKSTMLAKADKTDLHKHYEQLKSTTLAEADH